MIAARVAALLLLLAGPAVAQDREPPPALADGPLDLDAALTRARAVHPSAEAAWLALAAAQHGVTAARALDNPQLRVGLQDLSATMVAPTVFFGASVPIPNPWVELGERDEARAQIGVVQAEADEVQAALDAAVTLAFLDQLSATAWADALDAAADAAARLADRQAERAATGLATTVDVARARADTLALRDDAGRARADADAAQAALRALLAWPAELPLPLRAPPALSAPPAPAPPDDAEATAAAAHLRLVRGEALPWFDWIQAGGVFRADGTTEANVRLALRVPVWSFGTGAARAARAELAAARARAEAVAWDARAEVAARWAEVEAARARAAALQVELDAVPARSPDAWQQVQLDALRAALAARVARAARDAARAEAEVRVAR